ncbi:AIM24 family protein [Quadrisphaera sp. INWT6]|uniref:AIM24 family protein n=1 Tax=Quadrisphaera sp. INWT6 TaxID=2596917 RepID=UPI0018921C33|nr:AIM24 family protein [Quadrisphaera sp. INWT6]MBF5080528.1 AIM24 family protein [Quadrisphaera sp. INWT6]
MRSNLFDAATAEKQTSDRWVLQNSAMLRVSLSQDVLAAKGSMVAYQGRVSFQHEGSGSVAKFLKKVMTSEDTPLMRVSGDGEVFFANTAEHVHLVLLEGDGISVDGKNLLAFDASLDWDIRRVQGAGGLSGGMWNVEVSGHGVVALTSDGPPVLLDCSQQPTGVDIQAAVAWSSHLAPQLVNSMNVRSLLRGGSGEAFQYLFHGPGFVLVQPSEGRPLGGQGSGGGNSGGFLGDLMR